MGLVVTGTGEGVLLSRLPVTLAAPPRPPAAVRLGPSAPPLFGLDPLLLERGVLSAVSGEPAALTV